MWMNCESIKLIRCDVSLPSALPCPQRAIYRRLQQTSIMSGLPMTSGRRAQRQQKQRERALQAVVDGDNGDNDDAKRKAVMDVVQLWLDRLQLVSVITTFFASIDTTLLSFTTSLVHVSSIDSHQWSHTVQTMNAALSGALIFHICSAITSFVGSFVLIRYKLIDAKDHIPRSAREPTTSGKTSFSSPPELPHLTSAPATMSHSESHGTEHPISEATHALNLFSIWQDWSDSLLDVQGRIFIHRVRLFSCIPAPNSGTHLDPPVQLLSNCHTLSVTMAIIGFVLALLGILTFAWTSLPTSVATFASSCLGACGVAIFITFCFS